MDRDLLQSRLISYARWYAAAQGYRFGTDAEQDLAQMAEDAVQRIFGKKIPKRLSAQKQAMLSQAEASFAMLISTMIQGSKEITGYSAAHPDRIGEETLHWARVKLCPLFPIC